MDNINIITGIKNYISGNKSSALLIFIELLKRDLENEVAWLLLDLCMEDPEDKTSHFQKALSNNPNNPFNNKRLTEAEKKIFYVSRSGPFNDQGNQCPNCGNLVQKPVSSGIKQPGYLGKLITIPPLVEKDEIKAGENYLKNCEVALEGRKYDQALQFADKLLEIEPENVTAWINKAIATFWLTTEADNRFDEAMFYLGKAEKIEKDNPLIESTREQLREGQCGWYIFLGDQADELVGKILEENDSNFEVESGISEAKVKCQEYVIKAMNYYLLASKFDPKDLTSLSKMKYLAEFGNWLLWSSEIRRKISYFDKIDQKAKDCNRLNNLKMQLKESQAELSNNRKHKGLVVVITKIGLKRHITSLKKQIASVEKLINSQ